MTLNYYNVRSTGSSGTGDDNFPDGQTGQTSLSGANTATQLNGGTSITVPDGAILSLTALNGNNSAIYWGFSDNVTTSNSDELAAGQATEIKTTDVTNIWIVGSDGSDGASWAVEQE